MRVIGLIGPKGSGKDTSYELLKELKRVDGKLSFAGPLKKICEEVFGLHFNLWNDPVLKERELKEPITCTRKQLKTILQLCEQYVPPLQKDGRVLYNIDRVSIIGVEGRAFKTPREILQIIGTEFIRERVFKSWHLMAAFSDKALADLKKPNGTYAVTDVRFANEHDFLEAKFGASYKAFYVDRPESSKTLEESIAAGTAHSSETETQKIREKIADSVIPNAGTLEDLQGYLKGLELGKEGTEPPAKGSRFRYTPA